MKSDVYWNKESLSIEKTRKKKKKIINKKRKEREGRKN